MLAIPRLIYIKKPFYTLLSRSIVTHISPTTSLLRSDTTDNEVYLIGTAHVSDASTQEVVDLIRLVKPTTIFVELDASRAAQLRNKSTMNNVDSTSFDVSTITSQLLSSLPLPGNFKQILEMIPNLLKRVGWLNNQGGEMKAALEEADKIGARCVYGDIEISQTISEVKRELGSLMTNPSAISNLQYPSGDIMSMFGGLISGTTDPKDFVERIKTRDRAQELSRSLQQSFPSVYNVMITKRDIHMAQMLRKYCSKGKVVAVVGMAHVEGIEREWEVLDKTVRVLQ